MKKVLHKLVHAFIPHPHNDYRPHAFRHRMLSIYSLGLILSQFAFGLAYYTGPANVNDAQLAKNIVDLTNQSRTASGLGVVSGNTALEKAAYAKLTDMFQKNYWDHVSPTGTEAWYFIDSQGYDYKYAGENLAKGFYDANSVFNAWMGSSTHRANLLDNKHKDIGVAVGTGELDGKQTTIIVQLFGSQRAIAQAPAPVSVTQPVPAVPPVVNPPVANTAPVETPVPELTPTPVAPIQTPASPEIIKKAELKETIPNNNKLNIPLFRIKNATMPQKAPYLALWGIVLFLVMFDYSMLRRLGIHKLKPHRVHFGSAVALSMLLFLILIMSVASIA
ncbi:hypothetical protein COY62_03685 [bacterium (Candidatus Howlettbacteria) CG_4_10_14_0_8_um_filter_40_9]|nr:MAG: hypothetical protein COY62_03685 [bacterium (Candidatus Howlettbacteria) CG_4_10_14_0_8_um_filter_40_9]